MQHAIQIDEPISTLRSGALEIGQLAIVTEGHAKRHIVTKIYGGVVVSLNDPNMTWDYGTYNVLSWEGLEVRPLPKGTVITLRVGQGEDDLKAEVKRLLALNQVINAIKHVRTVKSWGLKEAKEYVDKIRVEVAVTTPKIIDEIAF